MSFVTWYKVQLSWQKSRAALRGFFFLNPLLACSFEIVPQKAQAKYQTRLSHVGRNFRSSETDTKANVSCLTAPILKLALLLTKNKHRRTLPTPGPHPASQICNSLTPRGHTVSGCAHSLFGTRRFACEWVCSFPHWVTPLKHAPKSSYPNLCLHLIP